MSRRERQRRKGRGAGGPRRPLYLALGLGGTMALIAVLGVLAWVISVAQTAPSLDTRKPLELGATSRVFAADGTRLGFIQADVLRTPILGKEIPQSVRDATVAVEDRRFFQHEGVDFEGIVRAAVKNIENRGEVQGGSTLTMQLVRNLYTGERERTLKRKIREAKLAQDLEDRHPGRDGKEWILTTYLNSVPYGTVGGQTAVGIQAAARIFFDKPAEELTLREAATLAGLPQAPSQYNPFLNPSAAKARRNDVLQRMADQGYISQETALRTMGRSLGVKRNRFYTSRRENYFFDYVKQELIDRYGLDRVRRGGLRIYTTIDLRLQRLARQAIQKELYAPDDPSAAVVSIDPRNGWIKAMASSARYGDSKFNLASQGHRQPGSTFKTMVLMTALRRGVNPNTTTYVSKPLKFTAPGYGPIDVKTYSNSYSGRINLVRATLASDNSVYQQLDLDLGPRAVRQTAYDMGITTKLNGYPAEGLGGLRLGVSPLEMARAYATIASGGYRVRPVAIRRVAFPDGHVDRSLGRPKRTKVFTDGVTSEATSILRQNILGGTGTRANIGCPAAGKTGTTDKHSDAWFAGYTPRMATVVWMGYPKTRRSMLAVHWAAPVAGGTIPAAIWADFMRRAKGSYCGDFRSPAQPFVSRPFYGRYSSSPPGGYYAPAPQYTPGYTPPAYTPPAAPQYTPPAPAPAPAPAPTPAPAPAPTAATGGAGATAASGGQRYPPTLYESAPQGAPATGGVAAGTG